MAGVTPLPRRRLNPALVAAVRASAVPRWQLAEKAGFPQAQQFSTLIHSVFVVASPRTVNRIKLLAAYLGYPPDRIFIDEGGAR